ncbi:acetyl-CoA carboxylase biotin carboxyl carrier protein [Rhizobium tropici]|uniref:Biotin carboxyl carrier protein of acetyl-CoA carboxylase n=1 Tax=Rhizobium tropici TaxID=398 RepID=A0A329YCC5_RHITR|nr:biotin/lipoyl-containing protein [Rhizobium tropici]RAX41147.1 acetyl-CoA carboxylase biotin carboxyl carrier protein subunit [Rhizobium tropici]
MNFEQIRALIKALDEAAVSELEYSEGNVRLRIVKQAASNTNGYASAESYTTAAAQEVESVPPNTPSRSNNNMVEAPLPGVFYRSASPGEPPFVEAGAKVTQGQTLALIEAMKMLTPVKATEDGDVSAVLVENGVSVEAGAALFEIAS